MNERECHHRVRARLALMAVLMSVGLAGVAGRADAQMSAGEHKTMIGWADTWFLLLEQLEYSARGPERPASLEARSWYGGANSRVWLRAEGEQSTAGPDRAGEGEAQLLYGRLVAPYWDAVIGLRGDRRWGDGNSGRMLLAIGLFGLSPYRFEVEPTLFVGTKGELSARMNAVFPLLITQRLILEPRMELDGALKAVPSFGVRKGLSGYNVGFRLRYEFKREFAPYVGIVRTRGADPIGSSPGLRSSAENRLVVGLRMWR